MDLKDFMQLHPPATKTSRFEAFKAELRTLQKNKYTIEQMLEFLQANDVQATRSSLYAFLKKSRIVRVAPQKNRKAATDAVSIPEKATPSEAAARSASTRHRP